MHMRPTNCCKKFLTATMLPAFLVAAMVFQAFEHDSMQESHPSTPEVQPIVQFSNSSVRWQIVNDGVMGGLSRSRLVRTSGGNALFSGDVSLRNNGGFASVRAPLQVDLHEYEGIHLRIRGDRQWYHFRMYTLVDGRVTPWAYEASFQSPGEEWVDVYLPFEVFKASFRGSSVPNAPALDPASIAVVGIMIKDRQQGPFALEVASIGAWRAPVVSGS